MEPIVATVGSTALVPGLSGVTSRTAHPEETRPPPQPPPNLVPLVSNVRIVNQPVDLSSSTDSSVSSSTDSNDSSSDTIASLCTASSDDDCSTDSLLPDVDFDSDSTSSDDSLSVKDFDSDSTSSHDSLSFSLPDAPTLSTASTAHDTSPHISMLKVAPPGSLLDNLDCPASPTFVADHPDLEASLFNDQYANPNSYDDASDDIEDPFPSLVEVRHRPKISGLFSLDNVWSRPRVCNLHSPPSPSIRRTAMSDPGANICITDVLELLHDVEDIKPFSVGLAVESAQLDDIQVSQCTKKGILMLPLTNGHFHPQVCYYNPDASDTIISPQAICDDSGGLLVQWSMCGNALGDPGALQLSSRTGLYKIDIPLLLQNGLYFCNTDDFALSSTPLLHSSGGTRYHVHAHKQRDPPLPIPTSRAKQLEAELWSARLGFPAEWQLEVITNHADGLPHSFAPHPFLHIPAKADAAISKQPVGKDPSKVAERGQRFFVDFGFMRASTEDYAQPDPTHARVVESYDGFSSYLAIVDEISKYMWVFLCRSKEPPIDIMHTFLTRFGHKDGGLLCTDQGGELARSASFRKCMLDEFQYAIEPTGADSPSQNGQVEKFNHSLGVTVRVLLYSSGLPFEIF